MFGSEILEVAIGIILLFLLISLICTALQEGMEGILRLRAAYLKRGIRELLNDPHATGMVQQFYNHPLIFSLFEGKYDSRKHRNLPCYIPASHFSGAVLDIVTRGNVVATEATRAGNQAGQKDPETGEPVSPATGAEVLTMEALQATISRISDPHIKRVMLSAIDTADGKIENVKVNLEEWFNGSMDRVSGWYKRRTQAILFAAGLLAAVVLNVDTITIAQRLTVDKTLREVLIAEAGRTTLPAASGQQAALQRSFRDVQWDLANIGYPIGWWVDPNGWIPFAAPQARCINYDATTCRTLSWGTRVQTGIGWLITALATMLGAPFWFDVLNKFMVIRSTVKPREKSQEEGSEDRPLTPQVLKLALTREK